MKDKRIVFMGTPDFAVEILKMLIDTTNVVLVVTQPDKLVGRKKELMKSPVKKEAELNHIPVFQPSRIREDFEMIRDLEPDLIVTCAYGQILPRDLLFIPKCGAINVHASLLPKYRGSAPIQWSLLNGDEKTGITLIYMDQGMDTGDMIAKEELVIEGSDDVGILHDKLSVMGAQLLRDNLEAIFVGVAPREKQINSEATIAPMIKRCDEHLDFSFSGKEVINKIRAFHPWPLANFILDGEEIKVLQAEFKKGKNTKPGVITVANKKELGIDVLDGIIYLKRIKPNGKKEMEIASFLNGKDSHQLLGKKVC